MSFPAPGSTWEEINPLIGQTVTVHLWPSLKVTGKLIGAGPQGLQIKAGRGSRLQFNYSEIVNVEEAS